MSTAFDTLKLADRLAAGGFTQEQAKTAASALSEALTADLATKTDLIGLATKADLAGLATKSDLTGLATKAELAAVRVELAEVKSELIKWVVGAVGIQTIAVLGALVTILKGLTK